MEKLIKLTSVNVMACIGGYYWSISLEDMKTNIAGLCSSVHVFVNYKSSDKPPTGTDWGIFHLCSHTWLTSLHIRVKLTPDFLIHPVFFTSQSSFSSHHVSLGPLQLVEQRQTRDAH